MDWTVHMKFLLLNNSMSKSGVCAMGDTLSKALKGSTQTTPELCQQRIP